MGVAVGTAVLVGNGVLVGSGVEVGVLKSEPEQPARKARVKTLDKTMNNGLFLM
jgi:hypothetical protein